MHKSLSTYVLTKDNSKFFKKPNMIRNAKNSRTRNNKKVPNY